VSLGETNAKKGVSRRSLVDPNNAGFWATLNSSAAQSRHVHDQQYFFDGGAQAALDYGVGGALVRGVPLVGAGRREGGRVQHSTNK
jgi:hypothetical protein